MIFYHLTLFETIWQRKFRILTRWVTTFLLTSTVWWQVFHPPMLWTYVQATYGRTGIHSEDVRPYTLRTYGHTAQDVRPKNKAWENRDLCPWITGLLAFWESHICPVGKPRLILSHSQRLCKNQNKRKDSNNAPLCQQKTNVFSWEDILPCLEKIYFIT